MAGEFLVRQDGATLVVHALPETETDLAIVLPLPVLSLVDKTYIKPPTQVYVQPTDCGPALLLESIRRQEEVGFGDFMETRAAASVVIAFFTDKPEVAYTVNDEHAVHIPDEFLDGMPPEFVATVLRVRDPAPHTGMYL